MAQPVVNKEDYPSWINDDVFRKARFQRDPRCNRSVIQRLDTTLSLLDGHRPKKWGFTIIRTAYGPGSDQKFEHALEIINNIAQHWAEAEVEGVKFRITCGKETDFRYRDVPVEVDTRPNEEFVRRYENDVVEDQSLENASLAAVREYFKTWIVSKGGRSNVGNTRYVACIMLDAETLSQLATAPKGFPHGCDVYSSSYWVKMVDVEPNPDEAVHVRVRGADDLIKYWFIRNLIRSHVLTHRKDREYPGVLHFGDPPSEGFDEAFGGAPLSLF
ncbi:uncharacterized protein FRV6_06868 [Fusarium oxysporum]|uniref:Uncharacterized protein n=1 Tax=Fusarium oxysporum TaxID=5507 RepID=A0A2H3TAI4_FUSOX|nr:uncharacterized protein FRV6_06868 [Fusarium oxysporum]